MSLIGSPIFWNSKLCGEVPVIKSANNYRVLSHCFIVSILCLTACGKKKGDPLDIEGNAPVRLEQGILGCPQGDTASNTEIALAEAFTNGVSGKLSSKLPLLVLDLGKNSVSDTEAPGNLTVYNGSDQGETYICNEMVSNQLQVQARIRGQSSRDYKKKNLLIKPIDSEGEQTSTSLLSLPKAKSFVLHGPWVDKSLMRNVLAYHLARSTGEVVSKTQYVELIIKRRSKFYYHGIYVLIEKINRKMLGLAKNKGEFDKGVDPFEQGAYVFRIDPPDSDKLILKVTPEFNVAYPKKKKIDKSTERSLTSKFKNIDDLIRKDGVNPEVWNYLDQESFINSLIVQDLAYDEDGLRKSQYLHKDVDQKIKMGPVWDFNLAFDNYIYKRRLNGGAYGTPSVFAKERGLGRWTKRFSKDKAFMTAYVDRWKTLRKDTLSEQKISGFIDEQYSLLKEAQFRDSEAWDTRKAFLRITDKNPDQAFYEEVEFLKSFTLDRMKFLDQYYEKKLTKL